MNNGVEARQSLIGLPHLGPVGVRRIMTSHVLTATDANHRRPKCLMLTVNFPAILSPSEKITYRGVS
jgi:hypothetical protein